MGRKREGGSTSEEGEREVEQRRDERGAGEVSPRGEREGGGVVVERGGAGAERGAGEVVLDEAVDADGGGRVAELDAGEEDEQDGERGGDGGDHLPGGRHGRRGGVGLWGRGGDADAAAAAAAAADLIGIRLVFNQTKSSSRPHLHCVRRWRRGLAC